MENKYNMIAELKYLSKELEAHSYTKEEALVTCQMLSRLAKELERELEKLDSKASFFRPS